MSSRALYVASTPMIALEAAAAALRQGGRAQLVLVEDFDLIDRLADLLQLWRDCPFEEIHRVPGRYTEGQRFGSDKLRGVGKFFQRIQVKRALRKQSLATLRGVDEAFEPDSVWVANDRKVEMQYALHLASRRGNARPGHYLDDGLYTYLGLLRQRPWVRRVDLQVKRLGYGRWWQQVPQPGTSPWISDSWLAFPEQAIDQDAVRHHHQLPRVWFTGRPFLRLSALAANQHAVDRASLRQSGIVLVLPHSNQLQANPALAGALHEFIAEAGARGKRVAVKYHPREVHADPAGLLASPYTVALPTLLPMELLLPLLPKAAVLAGEGSTALLAASWLRPDLRVFDLGLSRDGYATRARVLFARNGIPSIEGDWNALL